MCKTTRTIWLKFMPKLWAFKNLPSRCNTGSRRLQVPTAMAKLSREVWSRKESDNNLELPSLNTGSPYIWFISIILWCVNMLMNSLLLKPTKAFTLSTRTSYRIFLHPNECYWMSQYTTIHLSTPLNAMNATECYWMLLNAISRPF